MFGARLRIPGLLASSAGTRALVARPIHHEAAAVLADLGGDASNFAARRLTSALASQADLVLTMTGAHRDAVLELAPSQLHRTFTLWEAARLAVDHGARDAADLASLRSRLVGREHQDIPDPIGQGRDVFAEVGSTIAGLLPPILGLCRPT